MTLDPMIASRRKDGSIQVGDVNHAFNFGFLYQIVMLYYTSSHFMLTCTPQ